MGLVGGRHSRAKSDEERVGLLGDEEEEEGDVIDTDTRASSPSPPHSLSDASTRLSKLPASPASPASPPLSVPSPLSGLDQKHLLISRTLNSLGMGRYQWCIFLLCGYGYLLDLMWAHAFSLILGGVVQEFGIGTAQSGEIFTAFSAGLTSGALVWGVLVDIIGRKWAFNLTTLITSVFGFLIALPNSWAPVCALTAFCGFGLGGNIPIDATILLEFVPEKRRFLLVLLSAFQPLGVILTSILAWLIIPSHSCAPSLPSCASSLPSVPCCTRAENLGWRLLLYTLGGLTLLCFVLRFVVFRFRESPRFLLGKGRDREAVEVVRAIARFNGRECELTMEDLQAVGGREEDGRRNGKGGGRKGMGMGNVRALFRDRRTAWMTVLVLNVYIWDYWGFTVAGAFLPSILRQKGAERDVSIEQTYLNYIIISLSGLPGVFLGSYLIELPLLGRKWSMVLTSALMGASLVGFVLVDTQWGNVAFGAGEYFWQSAFNAILYGYAPELFPTPIRGTAVGLASCFGRLTSVVAPLIAARLWASGEYGGSDGVLWLAGAGAWMASLGAMGLEETRGREVY